MRIRRATRADLPAIRAIERQCPTAAHWRDSEYEQLFANNAPPRITFIVENIGVSGFLVARTAGPEWELENIAVAEAARGRGAGTVLVQALTAEADQAGAESIFLEVRASNTAARRLYAKCGFQQTSYRKNYYTDPPEDAAVYQWIAGTTSSDIG